MRNDERHFTFRVEKLTQLPREIMQGAEYLQVRKKKTRLFVAIVIMLHNTPIAWRIVGLFYCPLKARQVSSVGRAPTCEREVLGSNSSRAINQGLK